MNALTQIMMTKIDPYESAKNSKKGVVSRAAGSAAKWLRQHEQTENGKSFKKKTN